MPSGYYFTYGGQFENLKAANARLMVAVPIALGLIFVMLYFTFGSVTQAALIFTAIPLSAIGGIWALELRGMPFSISAGIGFIALFGVAVLNGIVLIGYFNQLKEEGMTDIYERIIKGTRVRLRPVLMTASVASLGFLPMALSNSGGAEVQRPLATVVIGGLITATFLTLVVLPILYSWLAKWKERKLRTSASSAGAMILLPLLFLGLQAKAQQRPLSADEAVQMALANHPSIRAANLQVQQSQALQNLPYSPGMTDISYQGNGLYRENGQRVNQFGFVQNLPNPAVTKSGNALQDEIVKSSTLQKALTEAELRFQVRQVFYDIQQKMELRALYQRLVRTYSSYFEIARKRVEVGATNAIEKLSIQSAMNEYKLLERQAGMEISTLEQQLRVLLNTDENVTATDSLQMLPYAGPTGGNTLRVQLAQQQMEVEQAIVPVIESSLKPGFNIGYSAQNYFDGGWLYGAQAGMQVPLFNKPVKKRLEAQQLQVEVADARYEAERLNVSQQLLSVDNSIRLYAEGAAYYLEQLESINPEIERISELNYQAGELSYLELLNTLNLLASNNKSYWEQVLAHNQAVALYQFFSNQ